MEINKQKITTPIAIIIAGLLIMIAILITGGLKYGHKEEGPKTLSEEVGVTKEDLNKCMEEKDLEALAKRITDSVSKAMVNVPETDRGTPYSVIVGNNGVMTEIRGAKQPEQIKELITEVLSGEVKNPYTGDLVISEDGDRINGNPGAPVKIITYSDLECPYCSLLNGYLKQIVEESDGQVASVFRHWPIHQNSFTKLVAAECVGDLLGNEAYFKYVDLVFGLMNEEEENSVESIL
jgi:protein-disulfide isomerase